VTAKHSAAPAGDHLSPFPALSPGTATIVASRATIHPWHVPVTWCTPNWSMETNVLSTKHYTRLPPVDLFNFLPSCPRTATISHIALGVCQYK